MFYLLLKGYARLAIRIYAPRLKINRPDMFRAEGPLLLACNHPNSFLDGIILTTLFEAPVHSLARGDAFRARWADRLLRALRLLPVYRTSEGVENLGHNYETFSACRKTFATGGIVLIFSEGRCENEWHLRPLRKGTARLAMSSWSEDLPLQVVPVALNYSSFGNFGKEIHIHFGRPIVQGDVSVQNSEGKQLLQFNSLLKAQLSETVYEIAAHRDAVWTSHFAARPRWYHYALLPFAFAGWLLHLPLYVPAKALISPFRKSGHYDSALISLLFMLYPFYLLFAAACGYTNAGLAGFIVVPVLPLLARCYVTVKYALDPA